MGKEKISLWKPFKRLKGFPLDVSTIWDSYESALDYAQNKGTAYLGQIVSVCKENESGITFTEAYIITENESGNTLTPLQSLSFDIDFSGYTIPAGTKFAEALQAAAIILEEEIDEAAKSGTLSKDIKVKSKETGEDIIISYSGNTITDAIQDVADYLYEHGGGGGGIANIKTNDPDILNIHNEMDETYIDFIGITNPEIIIE